MYSSNSLRNIKRLWPHFSSKRRSQLFILLLLLILSSFAELVSLTTVIPFLSLLIDFRNSDELGFINQVPFFLHLSRTQVLFTLFACFIVFTLFSSIFRFLVFRLSAHMSAALGSDIATLVYYKNISRPYAFHLENTSSFLITSSTTYVNKLIAAIRALLTSSASVVLSIQIIIALFVVNWTITLTVLLCFASTYCIVVRSTKHLFLKNSVVVSNYSKNVIQYLQESYFSIKDIILTGSQRYQLSDFIPIDYKYRRYGVFSVVLQALPQYMMESLGIIIISTIGIFLFMTQDSPSQSISILGFFAISFQKLLPCFQSIFRGWSTLKACNEPINIILRLLDSSNTHPLTNITKPSYKEISFSSQLSLSNLCFQYDGSLEPVLNNFNFQLRKYQYLGIVGASGSGKSTFIDILMGLLEPKFGNLSIDGTDIPISFLSTDIWRSQFAHVPQSMMLLNTTITNNIVFGESTDTIDKSRLMKSVQASNSLDFIHGQPQKFDTRVGELGVLLSGGQRQRLCIARALYRNPKILILDEATSALDTQAESEILSNLRTYYPEITVILITHSKSALKYCDALIDFSLNT